MTIMPLKTTEAVQKLQFCFFSHLNYCLSSFFISLAFLLKCHPKVIAHDHRELLIESKYNKPLKITIARMLIITICITKFSRLHFLSFLE